MTARLPRWLAALALAGAGACELREVTLTEPEDILVVESILLAGERVQTALLHRSFDLGQPALAEVRVLDEEDREYPFLPALDTLCFAQADTLGSRTGVCYAWQGGTSFVRPGGRYRLRVETQDGREVTGVTTVPEAFEIVQPTSDFCRLSADSLYTIVWTSAEGAWVYIAETRLIGLRRALERRGVPLDRDPLRLVGLSIAQDDTTLVFPAEFGVFDRFEGDATEALVAIQKGLPPDVVAEVVVGAADRNYVNWVRGGNFNPSGVVRVPSVFGERATGVFGSVVTDGVQLRTLNQPLGLPRC